MCAAQFHSRIANSTVASQRTTTPRVPVQEVARRHATRTLREKTKDSQRVGWCGCRLRACARLYLYIVYLLLFFCLRFCGSTRGQADSVRVAQRGANFAQADSTRRRTKRRCERCFRARVDGRSSITRTRARAHTLCLYRLGCHCGAGRRVRACGRRRTKDLSDDVSRSEFATRAVCKGLCCCYQQNFKQTVVFLFS